MLLIVVVPVTLRSFNVVVPVALISVALTVVNCATPLTLKVLLIKVFAPILTLEAKVVAPDTFKVFFKTVGPDTFSVPLALRVEFVLTVPLKLAVPDIVSEVPLIKPVTLSVLFSLT